MALFLAKESRAALDPRQLAAKALESPKFLKELTLGLDSDNARIKFGCAKALRMVSEEVPELLYPQFDFFVRVLDNKNKILQWTSVFVLSQLARVDRDDKFPPIFEKYFSPIVGPVMITAANVIRGGAQIARAKPHLADRIAAATLLVERARFQTAECRNVAFGHAIVALGEFFDLLGNPLPVLEFVRKQTKNPRPATSKKAARFLKQTEKLTQAGKQGQS